MRVPRLILYDAIDVSLSSVAVLIALFFHRYTYLKRYYTNNYYRVDEIELFKKLLACFASWARQIRIIELHSIRCLRWTDTNVLNFYKAPRVVRANSCAQLNSKFK